MIYVTGDTHGDIERFKTKTVKKLRKGDFLIVCGDFGFLWDGSKKEEKVLKWLGKRRYSVLFLEGTHDNLDLLNNYPSEDWNGGKVRRISGNLLQLVRGSVFTIEDKRLFVMGGGESTDLEDRQPGITWFSQEMPTEEEIIFAEQNLREHGHSVDYMLSHESSVTVLSFLDMDGFRVNPLNAFFAKLEKSCDYKMWFFGSYHLDKLIPPRYRAVFKDVVALE